MAGLEQLGAMVEIGAEGVTVAGPGTGAGLRGAELDLTRCPELLAPMAVTALFADGATRLVGVADDEAMTALTESLSEFGAGVTRQDDAVVITPPESIRWADADARGDRVLALSLGVAGLAADRRITVANSADAQSTWETLEAHLTWLTEG